MLPHLPVEGPTVDRAADLLAGIDRRDRSADSDQPTAVRPFQVAPRPSRCRRALSSVMSRYRRGHERQVSASTGERPV